MKAVERNKDIIDRIKRLKGEHPFWGYRRVWVYLKYREGQEVNKKRIYRLMKENCLLVAKETQLKAKRGKYPYRSKPRPDKPNYIWGIDMTKVLIQNFGWIYLHIVLDWFTKKITGYSLSLTSKTEDWVNSLDKAINREFPWGIKDTLNESLKLVSDNGSQPTSLSFMKACREINIKQIFTSCNNPKRKCGYRKGIKNLKRRSLMD